MTYKTLLSGDIKIETTYDEFIIYNNGREITINVMDVPVLRNILNLYIDSQSHLISATTTGEPQIKV